MLTVDVRQAVQGVADHADAGKKQVNFATRVALTKTAQIAGMDEVKEMRDVFTSPTPFTLSSVFVRPATLQNLSAEIKLKDFAGKGTPASKFLAPQISGGQRGQKRFERALQSVGAMPAGFRAVPGSGAKLDSYGNMNRGQIVQILSFFRAFPEMGYKANMTPARRKSLARGSKSRQGIAYFVGRPGDRLPLGIWQRVQFARGTAIKPVLIFVRTVGYEQRYDFEYVVEQAVKREFPTQFAQAFDQALRTAR